MNKGSFINTLPLQLKSMILNENPNSTELSVLNSNSNSNSNSRSSSSNEISPIPTALNNSFQDQLNEIDLTINDSLKNPLESSLNLKAKQFLISKLMEQKGIIFTEFTDIQLRLFDVDSTLCPAEFDKISKALNNDEKILLCEKIKLIYGFNSLTEFIIRLINILNFSTFFSIFDITSNIKLYGFYSLNYLNPVEILVKQIRHDLFIVKSFKEFTIQEMKKEHDFHLPYKEFKRLNLNDGNLVVVKILFKNEQKPIDLALIKPLLPKIKMLHLSLENESKLKPFNEIIDKYGLNLNYLKFGVNRGIFKKIPIKNNINTLKLVNIDNLNFINDLKNCSSLDVFFDNWELRKNCDIKFQNNFIIKFDIIKNIENLKILNIFHTYLDSKDLNKLKYFPNLTHSKISYVILDNDGFNMSECLNLQELKIHFTYQKSFEDKLDENTNGNDNNEIKNIFWPPNLKKLSITIHNIKNLIQNFSIRLNILKKISKPLPPSIIDLCIDISYDTGGSGPELYSISRDDILKISMLINKILTNNLENLKLKGISRYNYKIGKPLIFSAINFPSSLKLLSLNDFILDYNFINLPNLKKLYFEHSLFDSDFKLPDSDEILIEKCTFKDLSHLPNKSNKIEFKMCTFRKIPNYNGDVSNVIINNCRVMEQPMNNIFQFQQKLQMHHSQQNGNNGNNNSNNRSNLHNNHNNHNSSNNSNNSNLNSPLSSQPTSRSHSFQYNPANPSSNSLNSLNMSDNHLSSYQQQHQHQHQQQHHHQQQQQQQNLQNQHHQQQQQQQQQQHTPQFQMFSPNTFSQNNGSNQIHNVQSFQPHQHTDFNDLYSNNPQSDYIHFLNKDLELQLNNLSLNSNSNPNAYVGRINQQQISNNQNTNTPPLMSMSMSLNSPPTTSASSNNGSIPQQPSDLLYSNSLSNIMNQFNQASPIPKNNSSSIPSSMLNSPQQQQFGFFANNPLTSTNSNNANNNQSNSFSMSPSPSTNLPNEARMSIANSSNNSLLSHNPNSIQHQTSSFVDENYFMSDPMVDFRKLGLNKDNRNSTDTF